MKVEFEKGLSECKVLKDGSVVGTLTDGAVADYLEKTVLNYEKRFIPAAEIGKEWGVSQQAISWAGLKEKFGEQAYKKGGRWFITREGMMKAFGEPRVLP